MKKFTLIGLLLIASTAIGQIVKPSFNRWSIDANVGGNTALRDFTPGYRASNFSIPTAEIGVRYMFNSYFGLDLSVATDGFKNFNNTPKFRTTIGRINFQGNINLGSALNFYEFTEKFTIFAHGGVGVGNFDSSSFTLPFGNDRVGIIILGLAPQIKISRKLSFVADVSYIPVARKQHSWDNATLQVPSRPFKGEYFTYTAGLTYYLGGFDEHADWSPSKGVNQTDMDALRQELEKMRKNMKDDDNDGVPNYLDNELETPDGNKVDSKGVTDPSRMDTDMDGIADLYDLCPEVEGKFSTNGCPDGDNDGVADKDDKCPTTPGSAANAGCPDKGAGNKVVLNPPLDVIYFDLGEAEINKSETAKLKNILEMMEKNPSYKLLVKGHTDNTGGFELNVNLSEDRAQTIINYLIKNGIDASRLEKAAFGPSVPASTGNEKASRAKNRRVEFEARN
ncbi:MAG: OmpA family protein [Bacteroidetes bacterium]|nr:OmpA family protein [Bacteroidota bacterium]